MTMSAASETKIVVREPEHDGRDAEDGDAAEHLRADVARQRAPGERHRDDRGADARRGAQPAESVRPDVQDVARVRRQQRDAPPNSTAKRSSETAPRITFLRQTNCRPSSSTCQVSGFAGRAGFSVFTPTTSRNAAASSPATVA